MKKILYPLFMALALGFSFAACDDDDDNGDAGFANTPEIDAAGVYAGTMSYVQDGKTDTLYAAGTITITPTDSAYCADVTYDCSGDVTYNGTSVANITHDNDGFAFFNPSTSNGMGTSFMGRIDGAGNIESSFDRQIRQGRLQYTYHYKFIGRKQ